MWWYQGSVFPLSAIRLVVVSSSLLFASVCRLSHLASPFATVYACRIAGGWALRGVLSLRRETAMRVRFAAFAWLHSALLRSALPRSASPLFASPRSASPLFASPCFASALWSFGTSAYSASRLSLSHTPLRRIPLRCVPLCRFPPATPPTLAPSHLLRAAASHSLRYIALQNHRSGAFNRLRSATFLLPPSATLSFRLFAASPLPIRTALAALLLFRLPTSSSAVCEVFPVYHLVERLAWVLITYITTTLTYPRNDLLVV